MKMWDCSTGKQFDLPIGQPKGFVFSRDSATLVVADHHPGQPRDLRRCLGKAKHTLRETLGYGLGYDDNWQSLGLPFALSPDGKTLVFATRAGQLQHYSTVTGKALPAAGIATEVAEALAFSPTGKSSWPPARRGCSCMKWTAASRLWPSWSSRWKTPASAMSTKHRVAIGNRYYPNANCAALASDGQRAAVGWTNGLVTVWDTASGKLLWQQRVVDVPIHCVTFAADDQTVISSGLNGQVVWYSAATGQIRRKLERACPEKSSTTMFLFLSGLDRRSNRRSA